MVFMFCDYIGFSDTMTTNFQYSNCYIVFYFEIMCVRLFNIVFFAERSLKFLADKHFCPYQKRADLDIGALF